MPISRDETRRHSSPQYLCSGHRHSKLLLFFLQCVVMVFAISLFLFFLGFAALVLIHFLFLSNTYHRRFRRRIHSDADDTEAHLALSSFPIIDYNAVAHPRLSDCAICLDGFQEGDECRSLPPCEHLFHANCVDRWIMNKPTCPVCRTEIGFSNPWRRTRDDDQWKRLWIVECEDGTTSH